MNAFKVTLFAVAACFSLSALAAPTGPEPLRARVKASKEKMEILYALAESEEVLKAADENMSDNSDLEVAFEFVTGLTDGNRSLGPAVAINFFMCSETAGTIHQSTQFCKVDFVSRRPNSTQNVNIEFLIIREGSEVRATQVKKVDAFG